MVVYPAYRELQGDSAVRLFAVPIDGSQEAVELSETSVGAFRITPDETRAGYTTGGIAGIQLLSVPIDGQAAPIRLGGCLPVFGDLPGLGEPIQNFQISADGIHVVYIADQDTDDFFELYSSSTISPARSIPDRGGLK